MPKIQTKTDLFSKKVLHLFYTRFCTAYPQVIHEPFSPSNYAGKAAAAFTATALHKVVLPL
jgi:hypothetical protein